jgi:hypothetical protein
MFLLNTGLETQVHTASQPRITSTLTHPSVVTQSTGHNNVGTGQQGRKDKKSVNTTAIYSATQHFSTNDESCTVLEFHRNMDEKHWSKDNECSDQENIWARFHPFIVWSQHYSALTTDKKINKECASSHTTCNRKILGVKPRRPV